MTKEAPQINLQTTATCDESSCEYYRTPGRFDSDIYTMGKTIGGNALIKVSNCAAQVQGITPTIGNRYCDSQSEDG